MRITEIFTSIQGEGAKTGIPMHFIRFAGCNLNCPGCDTAMARAAKSGKGMEPMDVVAALNEANHPKVRWVCFTGGEPTLQQDGWSELIRMLQGRNYRLAIETNGTIAMSQGRRNSFEWIVVSPKTSEIRTLPAIAYAHEVKFVLGHPNTFSSFAALQEQRGRVMELNSSVVFSLQPWLSLGTPELRADATSRAFEFALRSGMRLSIQVHKRIGVR